MITYIDERNGKEKIANHLDIIQGDNKYRINIEYGEMVITKINFDDNVITVSPKVRNQISIK
jgi:hypothetical protein